jgi:DTW domain-containing protein YfiP
VPATEASDAAAAAALGVLLTTLLEDPAVRARMEADPELRAAWSDTAVRAHVMSPRAPAGDAAAGMAAMYELVRRLVEQPAVQARIEADTVLRQLWSDPDVRQHILRGGHH